MDLFWITLRCVATMLLYAVPGFLLIKTKKMKPEHIPLFSVFLIYVTAPCMNINAFIGGQFEKKDLLSFFLFFICGIVVQCSVILISYALLRRKYSDARYKILTLATILGNCGFMGIPLLRAVLPHYPLAIPLSIFFALGMNILLFTMGYFIITGDKKYISIRQLLLNPATVSVVIGLTLFILITFTPFKVPGLMNDAIAMLGNFSTPLCMLVIGMRLATMQFRYLVCEPVVYAAIAVKQVLVPLVIFCVIKLLPFDPGFESTLFVLTSVPVAAMILNAGEILNAGQKEAAAIVLMSTMSSVISIPLLMLLM